MTCIVNLSKFSFINLSKSIILYKNMFDCAIVFLVFCYQLINVKFVKNVVIEQRDTFLCIQSWKCIHSSLFIAKDVLTIPGNCCPIPCFLFLRFWSTVNLVIIFLWTIYILIVICSLTLLIFLHLIDKLYWFNKIHWLCEKHNQSSI